MDKLIFLYDALMTEEQRKKILLNAEFLTCGQMQGKMRWMVSYRSTYQEQRRIFAIPKNTSKVIYGGIFLVKDWELHRQKVHAYYHNSIPNCGHTLQEDLFDYQEIPVRPIKIKNLKDLTTGRYKVGNDVPCGVFVGNSGNGRVYYNSKNEPYYDEKRIDKNNFIQMIKENSKTKEATNGLE